MNAKAIKVQEIQRARVSRGRGLSEATIRGREISESLLSALAEIDGAAGFDLDTLREIGNGDAALAAAAIASALRAAGGWRVLKSGDSGFTPGMLTKANYRLEHKLQKVEEK